MLLLDLCEKFLDCPWDYTLISLVTIDQPIHRICLPTACLAIGKNSRMKASHDLFNKEIDASPTEDSLLRLRSIKDRVERIGLLFVIFILYPIETNLDNE